jgi:hypothetical protein
MWEAIAWGYNGMRQLSGMSTSFFGREDRVYVLNDENGNIHWLKLYGLKRGVNTDQNGWGYAEISDSGGNKLIEIYSDGAKTALVANALGTGLATEVLDVVEQNNSGVTGRIKFEMAFADADIKIIPRWNVPGLSKNFDSEAGDPELTDDYSSYMAGLETLARSIGADLLAKAGIVRDQTNDGLFTGAVAEVVRSSHRLTGRLLQAISNVSQGQLEWDYSGIVPDLASKMDEEDWYLKPCVVAAGAISAGSGNAGSYNWTRSPKQYAEDGDTVRVECISTLGSVNKERFSVGSVNRGEDPNRLTIAQDFDSRQLGILLRLERDMLLTGVGAAYLTNPTITGETSTYVDMNSKKLYGIVSKSGLERRVRLYQGIDRLDTQIVADTGTLTPTEPETVSATSVRNSGITMTFLLDASGALDGDHLFEVELNIANVGDWWEFDLSNDMAGIWVVLLGRIWLYDGFPTTGSTQVPEELIRIWDETLNGKWTP